MKNDFIYISGSIFIEKRPYFAHFRPKRLNFEKQNKICLTLFGKPFWFFTYLFFISGNAIGQFADWQLISTDNLPPAIQPNVQKSTLYKLDNQLIDSVFLNVYRSRKHHEYINLSVPGLDGTIRRVRLLPNSLLPNSLPTKYDNIRSFDVFSEHNTAYLGKMTWDGHQIFAHFVENHQSYFIRPLVRLKDVQIYEWHRQEDLSTPSNNHICGCTEQKTLNHKIATSRSDEHLANQLRQFRIAITTTPAFTNAVGGTAESALSFIARALNSTNLIFEKELGVQFILHENNDQLIFTDDRPAPFSGEEDAFEFWEKHPQLLDSLIGNDSYDIGHVFGANCNGGAAGVAALTGVCSVENKGRGVTCLFGDNTAEFQRTLYHELGHQFGANHTWSNCGEAVNDGQRNASTAVEVGSGSTIMSYGGICGPNFDVVSNSQNYFHGISLLEMNQALQSDSITCFQTIEVANQSPIVFTTGDTFYIPLSTPFELEAIGLDGDEDVLSFNWEQLDTGAVSPVGEPVGSSPSFRSFQPTSNPVRVFPRNTNIILNNSSRSEVLPDTGRMLTFGVTVRDNFPLAGATGFAQVRLVAVDETGPFRISTPNVPDLTYEAADSLTIGWVTAGTTEAPISCSTVDVWMSFDNGQSFDYLLASNTSNDGAVQVVLPDTTTNRARIKIKCSDNVFFDINNHRFRLVEKLSTSTTEVKMEETRLLYPNPARQTLYIRPPDGWTEKLEYFATDALGRILTDFPLSYHSETYQLDVSNLPSGVYWLNLHSGEHYVTQRFIIH